MIEISNNCRFPYGKNHRNIPPERGPMLSRDTALLFRCYIIRRYTIIRGFDMEQNILHHTYINILHGTGSYHIAISNLNFSNQT